MKNNKNTGSIVLGAAALLVLILDSQTAAYGATEGIALCLRTVIPSLFPMMVLTSLLTQSLFGQRIPLLGKMHTYLGMPPGSEGYFIAGLLGGYPIGARCIAQAHQEGKLTKQDAEHMLGFCSNAGPAFIFGICSTFFESSAAAWLLWGVHILSCITVGILTENKPSTQSRISKQASPSLTDTVKESVKVMGIVSGWIVIFRVIIRFLQSWVLWLFPDSIQVLISGIIELTNGCCMVGQITDPNTRFVLCSLILAAGGLCVFTQTLSVTAGLHIRKYVTGKLLQALFSLFYSFMVIQLGLVSLIILPAVPIVTYYFKKTIAFRKQMVYNTGELCKKR